MDDPSYAEVRGIDVTMLRAFDALIRERSVSRAAARLFLSQPAVSACLKRLRVAFGDELFVRTQYGVEPTPRALALAPGVESVLSDLQRLMSRQQPFDPAASDRILRVAGSDHLCRTLMPGLCQTLGALGSRMRVSWSLADYSKTAEELARGDIDLALIPRITQVTGVQTSILCEDSYVGVARMGHPVLASGLDLDAFCAWRHVVLGQSRSVLDDTIDSQLARLDRRRVVQAGVNSFSQMVDLLAETDLIAVFPQRVARRYLHALGSRPLPLELPDYRLHACWHKRSEADEAVVWLRGQVIEAIERTL
ncbi:LysR family transcriptional regulator [Hydrogenophaga borbori]|uniref:LysR family transcriptional regulator n=1 Tax=Hydrogenophaga borbori TaxID=2294117 RepID=UPI00301E082A